MKRRNYNGVDANWVAGQKQPVRTEMVETMLKQHRFIREPQVGTSHIKYSHPLLSEPVIIVSGTHRITNHINAAEKCLEVREIVKAAKQAKLEAKKRDLEGPKADFTGSAADSGLVSAIDNVPKNIEVTEFEGLAVLRSTRIPQIGDIASLELHPDELQAQCDRINERASASLTLLGEMNRDYETEFSFDDGTLTVEQNRYGLNIEMPPYDPTQDHGFVDQMESFRALLNSYDDLFRDPVVANIDLMKGHPKSGETVLPNGDVTWVLATTNLYTRKPIKHELTMSPQHRMSPVDFYKFADSALDKEIGGKHNSRFLSTALTRMYGVSFGRPKIPGTKKKGDILVITHPFFPEWKMEMMAPDTIPLLSDVWRQFEGASDAGYAQEMMDAIYGVGEQRAVIINTIAADTMKIADLLDENNRVWNKEASTKGRKCGLAVLLSRELREKDLGVVKKYKYGDAKTGENIELRGFYSNTPLGVVFHPDDLAAAKEFVDNYSRKTHRFDGPPDDPFTFS